MAKTMRETTTSVTSLDGYAFDCGGLLLGFHGTNQIVCLSHKNTRNDHGDYMYTQQGLQHRICGEYGYNGSVLSGFISKTGSFVAYSMDIIQPDNILVSFQSDLGVSCHAVSLDWPNYSASRFMGVKCPIQQNGIPNLFFQKDNHFSFGLSGDVALRSPIQFVTTGRQLVRDSYGIYKLYDYSDEQVRLRIYFGPQQGQPLTVLEGTLHTNIKKQKKNRAVELFIHNYDPPGPCVHDEESYIQNVTELPRQLQLERQHQQQSVRTSKFKLFSKLSSSWSEKELTSNEKYLQTSRCIEQAMYWIVLLTVAIGLGILAFAKG